MSEEIKKQKFEVKYKTRPDGKVDKAIFIGGELFDYEIDKKSYQKACEMGPEYQDAIKENITQHLVDCLSEHLERKITVFDLINAINTGEI